MVAHLASEPMPLASNKEIVIFREMKKQEINAQKAILRTDLDVVGALAVVEDDFDNHRVDPITFSRYALGMMIGNGYPDGVTTGLKASVDERAIIERVVSKAAAHSRNLQFAADQIWSVNNSSRATDQHVDTLNRLSLVAPEEPFFEYAPQLGERYQDLDQILQEICASFAGTPAAELMRQAQINLANLANFDTKPFLLTFISLSEFEQSEIIDMFNKYQTDNDMNVEDAFGVLAASCANVAQARLVVESHVLTPVAHLIAAIPAGYITKLDHTGSTLPQRDAIRAFVGEVNKLTHQRKEICLNALFGKLNDFIPAAANAIMPAIQDSIDAILLKPIIANQGAAINFTLTKYDQIKTCIDAIKGLEPIWQDIHYRALISKIRLMNLDTKNKQINLFNRQKNTMINELIASRIKAITPPKELISPVPIAANPAGSVDSVVALALLIANVNILEHINIYGEAADAFGPASNDYRIIDTGAAVNKRLANFLAHHCIANYIPAAGNVQKDQIIDAIQIHFNAIDVQAGITIIEKKRAKVALVEAIMHRLLNHTPRAVAVRKKLQEMGIGPQEALVAGYADIVQQVEDSPLVNQYDYSDIHSILGLINTFPPPEMHVYTNMEKIKELPSVDWQGALDNYVFAEGQHPELSRQPAETDQVYWARIGLYCIDAYNRKIKPHLFPAGLLANLNAAQGAVPQLLPFTAPMFDGVDDASNVYSFYTPPGAAGFAGGIQNIPVGVTEAEYKRQIHDFDLTRPNLNQQTLEFRQNISRAYERIHAYAIKTLTELFGTGTPLVAPSAGENLAHQWDFPAGFTPERIELCKKALLIFAYFDRAGDNYAVDYADMQMLMGRFAHCPDGKKTGIETIATRTLTALSGQVLAAAGDFDTYVKNIILRTFKSDSIEELSAHEHYENVSIVATIKHRNQAFWNTPTDILPHYIEHYFDSDYAFKPSAAYGNGDQLQRNAHYPNIDRLLQYFYQHIYAGPHELVNQIYQYLHSANQVTREEFFEHVRTMLKTRRPCHDWAEEDSAQDFIRVLMQERYCEVIAPTVQAVAAAAIGDELEPDYMFTRRGLETILFYAGYLAWNGPADQHPLIADWHANLAWLHAHDPDAYSKIYTQ